MVMLLVGVNDQVFMVLTLVCQQQAGVQHQAMHGTSFKQVSLDEPLVMHTLSCPTAATLKVGIGLGVHARCTRQA